MTAYLRCVPASISGLAGSAFGRVNSEKRYNRLHGVRIKKKRRDGGRVPLREAEVKHAEGEPSSKEDAACLAAQCFNLQPLGTCSRNPSMPACIEETVGPLYAGECRPGYVPYRLVRLFFLLSLVKRVQLDQWDVVELFAGVRSIQRGFQHFGMTGEAADITIDPRDDILTSIGFARSLLKVAGLKRNQGLVTSACVCSTWVNCNRGTSGRSRGNPLGNFHYPSVAEANLMVSRTVLLCLFALWLGCQWLWENPVSSIVDSHPRLQAMLALRGYYMQVTSLGMFGADSPKMVKLWCSQPWVLQLHRRCDRSLFPSAEGRTVIHYEDKDGVTKYKGGPLLKSSQHYPDEFGRCIAKAFQNYRSSASSTPSPVMQNEDIDFEDMWEDANLGSVENLLMLMYNSPDIQ